VTSLPSFPLKIYIPPLLVALAFVCFGLCQQVQSATDTPDPGSVSISNTADGQPALASVTTGIYNSAFGIYSLLSLTDGNFNTAVGGATLMVNTASENTATGAGALFWQHYSGREHCRWSFRSFQQHRQQQHGDWR
jgi:hypothetical protein